MNVLYYNTQLYIESKLVLQEAVFLLVLSLWNWSEPLPFIMLCNSSCGAF